MLGLPQSTDYNKQITKDDFFKSLNVKTADKKRFDSQIHSIIVKSIISPNTVNLSAGKYVPSIYVFELRLNTRNSDDDDLLLLDKMGHKAIYVLSYGSECEVAVVERLVFRSEWSMESDSIHLDGLNLDQAWQSIVCRIGKLPRDIPLDVAVSKAERRRKYDAEIAKKENQFNRTKQNHERRRIWSEIGLLKKERDSEDRDTGPMSLALCFIASFAIPCRAV